jgi:hypothetical protein
VPTVAELTRYIPLVKLEEALTRPQIQADGLIPAQRAVAWPQPHQPADPVLGDYLLEGLVQAVPGQQR